MELRRPLGQRPAHVELPLCVEPLLGAEEEGEDEGVVAVAVLDDGGGGRGGHGGELGPLGEGLVLEGAAQKMNQARGAAQHFIVLLITLAEC